MTISLVTIGSILVLLTGLAVWFFRLGKSSERGAHLEDQVERGNRFEEKLRRMKDEQDVVDSVDDADRVWGRDRPRNEDS